MTRHLAAVIAVASALAVAGLAATVANSHQASDVSRDAAPQRAAATQSDAEPGILTPPAPHEPRINGPGVYGVRPGRPFLYRIPATGDRPMRFAAENLPAGLRLDPAAGIISGTIASREARTYAVNLAASNARGRAGRGFRIVVGDTLALTPPMGWNDWYTFYEHPSDALMRRAADIIVQSGMADHGYQYVNIDDSWMLKPGATDPDLQGPPRDARGMIEANKRFPDMKAMTAYIHGLGLKAGIYTSPGPQTCAGFHGSYRHEALDVTRFVEWGFDFLKYDWCSYGDVAPKGSAPESERLQKPYRTMGSLLAGQPRDIVFNLCQYGMGDVWSWGGEVGGHSWRTTGDLGLEKGQRLPGFYSVGFKNAEHTAFARPGRWNDPDYILIGYVGNAHSIADPPRPTTLTPNEQYAYLSMWALMAAPLFYSGDITRLDDFTLNVLCNAEVIAIDQDALGRQARIVRKTENEFVLAKPLEDGSVAVGLFNLSEARRWISVTTGELGISKQQRVRDLWRWKDVGTFLDTYGADVGRHGVTLVRMWSR
jgi:alpha-galactosidase